MDELDQVLRDIDALLARRSEELERDLLRLMAMRARAPVRPPGRRAPVVPIDRDER